MGAEVRRVSGRRGGRVVAAHKARSFAEAEQWDIEYWLRQTPEARLEALETIRKEWARISHDLNR